MGKKGFFRLVLFASILSFSNTFASSSNFELNYDAKKYNFWIKYYKKRSQARFQRHMNNGGQYYNLVRKIFRQHGLPEDLFFVGLIESGFNSKIKSHAGAKGHWQFMKGTGKEMGLRIDGLVDERHNIVKSTNAAARYFKDLYNIFGSWELALCSYNAGPYKIIRAIQRGNTRNYRELVRKRLIPKETIYYIPKVMAARTIFKNPGKYGFSNVSLKGPFNKLERAKVYRSFDLNKLARQSKVSRQTLLKFNPDIKARYVRVRKGRPFSIYLPKNYHNSLGKMGKILDKSTSLENYTKKSEKDWNGIKFYRVKSGDNLSQIAQRFGVSSASIIYLNKLKKSQIYPGQMLRLERSNGYRTYVVKAGDNLHNVAGRFKTTVQKIRRTNRLKSSKIFIGQKIYVPKNI